MISVITPSFNQGRFIERTIQSVLSQSSPCEYVIFDGGSTDETITVLKKYQSKLRWVSEKDKGQAHAVNKGITSTSGEIIGWLNSDDIYLENTFSEVEKVFREQPEIDIVYGNAWHIDETDAIIEPYPTEDWNLARLYEVCFISQPALFFRRSVVQKFGLLDETLHFCMDYEYWLRLGLGGARFYHLDTPLAGSRLYLETKTLGQRDKVHNEINRMLKMRLGRVPDRWLFNFAHAYADGLGISRNDRRFLRVVSVESIKSAFKWNHSVSVNMLKTITQWLMMSFRAR